MVHYLDTDAGDSLANTAQWATVTKLAFGLSSVFKKKKKKANVKGVFHGQSTFDNCNSCAL